MAGYLATQGGQSLRLDSCTILLQCDGAYVCSNEVIVGQAVPVVVEISDRVRLLLCRNARLTIPRFSSLEKLCHLTLKIQEQIAAGQSEHHFY